MFSMLFYIFFVSFGIVVAQERDKFCIPSNPPLSLPACTNQCLIGDSKVLDGNCADNLVGLCELSDTVHIHFNMYGQCLLDACPSVKDRQDYVNMFMTACEGGQDSYFENRFHLPDDEFNYKDLLMGTRSGSVATSTDDSTSTSKVTSTSTYRTIVEISTTATSAPSKSPSTSSSSETEKPSDAPSLTPPPAASTLVANPWSSTDEEKPTSTVEASPPDDTGVVTDVTDHSHTHTSTLISAPPKYTGTDHAGPALSTTTIAGIAAGGTVAIASIIGLVFFFLCRRKHQASFASSVDIWEPSRNTSPKPKLPVIENDSNFGQYSEVGAGAPMRQRSKAELHSESIPRPQTAHNGYPNPPYMRGGGGFESTRYYNNPKQPEKDRHGSNMDSRYPEMGSHAVTKMPSPTSPVSDSSTIQNWHVNRPSGVPTIRMSSADLRSERMRSPVSELGTNAPLRSTRSVELHGAEITSPVSELGTESLRSGDNDAAELHTDPVLPPKLASGSRGDMTAVIAEMEDSNMQKGHRNRVSTNF